MARWKELLTRGSGDNEPEEVPSSRPRGLVARTEEGIEKYKESIGLLQQLADMGLKKIIDDPDSDYRLRPQSMLDIAAYKISSGRGHIIHIRVPGKPEAKALQEKMRAFLELPEDQPNPLSRQKRKEIRDGQPAYEIALSVGEGGMTPEKTKALLEGTLRSMDITPDWKTHYIKSDRETNRAVAEEQRKLREALEQLERDEEEAARKGKPTGSGLSEAERADQRRHRLGGGKDSTGRNY